LAIARTPYFDDLDPEIAKAVETAIGVLSRLTAGVSEVTLPLAGFLPGDLFSNLRAIEAYAYHAEWITKSPEKYQRVTRDRIIQLSAGVQAADYVQARRQLDRLRREIKNTFSNVDLLITPTMPRPPVPIEEGGTFEAVPTRNTAPFDVFGLPTISVPCGFMSAGLPIGLQIIGAPFAESRVLALAHAYEQVTEWHNRHPKLNTV
jgi:aspartyl-tRNA(Asn)/glutamyl-tRNA(Gln) amidotransferase subunit A